MITNSSGFGFRVSGVCTALATGSVFGQVSPTYAPDAVCVKWVDENAAKAAESDPPVVMVNMGWSVKWRSKVVGMWTVVQVGSGEVQAAIDLFSLHQDIVQVTKVPSVGLCSSEPNDPLWVQQKARFGDGVCLPGAWSQRTVSDRTIIAVIDSGVRYDLPQLNPNMWKNPIDLPGGGDQDGNGIPDDIYGASFVRSSVHDCGNEDIRQSDPVDRCGHGTAVASIIGAVGNDGMSMTGIAWKCEIMAVKLWGDSPTVALPYADDAVRGMEYAYSKGARIMNCSWYCADDLPMMRDFIAATSDALYVIAAGNFAFNLDEPGASQIYPQVYPFDNMIVVGNSNHQDGLTESCRGQISVDLFAPGDGLPFPNHGLIALDLEGNQRYLAGTSAAAPIVTAIAALRWSLYPAETPSGIRQKLIQSVDQVPALFECVSGGRLNAAKALGGSCD